MLLQGYQERGKRKLTSLSETSGLGKKRIMIVDYSEEESEKIKEMLQNEYEVFVAKTGVQALGYLQDKEIPHLILLDLLIPETHGMDVLKTLKSTPRLRQIPVIFLTNMDDMALRMERFGNGGDDFTQKPIHKDLMKLKIRRQLYIAQLEQENQILQLKLQSLRNRIDRVFDEVF